MTLLTQCLIKLSLFKKKMLLCCVLCAVRCVCVGVWVCGWMGVLLMLLVFRCVLVCDVSSFFQTNQEGTPSKEGTAGREGTQRL